LVCGGGSPGWLTSAEIYDPVAATWAFTESMRKARAFHAATPLDDGKVLVTGGEGEGLRALSSVEIYLPREGTWVGADPMDAVRAFHTATKVPNGKVVVTGGNSPRGPVLTMELYDPRDGTWTAAGELPAARYRHTASMLPDGGLLLVGGRGGKGALATAERLSFGAAQAQTTATTFAQPAPRPAAKPAPEPPELEKVFWVQLGAFADVARADALANALNADGNFVEVFSLRSKGVQYKRVRVGPFGSVDDARRERDQLALQHIDGVIVEQLARKKQ
ncbi:MAG: SPOR domain-containing protein, partial [Elusimicrobia bacterium]|nr:SPOR domain-containing protein [Elusimicrobiota bacterium]